MKVLFLQSEIRTELSLKLIIIFFTQFDMNIKIQNITKNYGPQKAVDDISFEVKTGEILGFLGPNGAGKTTTMKIITSYIEMDQGEVFIDGESLRGKDMKKHIGYLPENNPLYMDMPVMDYLAFCAALQRMPKSRVDQRVREMIRVCGLDVEKHKNIGELSKGFRQSSWPGPSYDSRS